MYHLYRKQLDRLNKGHPVSVALPPEPACIEAAENGSINAATLLAWCVAMLPGLGRATIERAYLTTVWLNCENPIGGMTEYFGAIIPDIDRHSKLGLPAIPVSVVVCEIRPPGCTRNAERIQWPGGYTSPSGYSFGGPNDD